MCNRTAPLLQGLFCLQITIQYTFLTDRVKTNNKGVINNIATINEAMSKELDGDKHTPEKITFKYLKYSISDLSQQAERRHGATYKVSPFALLINDGNYYLLAFDDYAQDLRTYRVDRMKSVNRTGEPREGEKVFLDIDLKTYTQRVFSMFGGKQERVTIRFINPLLDTVVDRFGTKGVQYSKVDDTHFSITGVRIYGGVEYQSCRNSAGRGSSAYRRTSGRYSEKEM